MKLKILKKEVYADCELCNDEDCECAIVTTEDMRAFIICPNCQECLNKIFGAEIEEAA